MHSIGHLISIAPLLLGALLPALGCGGSASADAPDLLPAMLAEIQAMPRHDTEPATFDRYVRESHAAALEHAFAEGARPDDPAAGDVYAVEIYRLMVDRAFAEGRTDLADILTRAYLAAVR